MAVLVVAVLVVAVLVVAVLVVGVPASMVIKNTYENVMLVGINI